MGNFDPITPILGLGMQIAERHSQQRAAEQAAAAQQADYAARVQQVQQAQAYDKQRRETALKAALASRRAAQGAAGVGSASGSGRALLLGLAEEAATQDRFDAQVAGQRLDDLSRSAGAAQQRNLLELADLRRRTLFGLGRQLPTGRIDL